MGRRGLGGVLAVLAMVGGTRALSAQNFGILIQRKKVTLQRKLPPTGHIEGTTFKVEATAPAGFQDDLKTDLASTLESMLIRNDSRLRSETGRADTVITCRITSFSTPQPQVTSQAVYTGSKTGTQAQPMERVTGVLTVSFQAKDKNGRSLSADNVTAKFDQEYTAAGANQGIMHSMSSAVTKVTKGATEDDRPPTPVELHNKLIQEAAQQITAHLVNTTEQVEVYLARGGGLDEADKLAEAKLWTRALESLETMKPFDSKENDAYRLYNLGVVNEALAYQAEDVAKARKYLQEAAIDYGKAIDGKPTEKYFMQPQTRIDTALAHYKLIGDQKVPSVSASADKTSTSTAKTASSSATTKAAPADAMTNDQVISMVASGVDEANIIDTIQHAPSVNFDLSVQGQVDLSKNKVPGRILTAMKARARTPATHRTITTGKTGG